MKQSDLIKAGILLLALIVFMYFFTKRTIHEDFPGENKSRLAHSLLEKGDLDEALKTFDESIALNSDFSDSYRGRGITLMQMERFDESVRMFDKAIEIDGSSALAFANRGVLNDRVGRYEDAIKDYRKALELDPKLTKGPGLIWRFLRNVRKKPTTIADRAKYLEEELKKPKKERLLRIPEIDAQERMYKK
ncbi:MAG: tetratricopeptide repeat protein [Thermodesulfovibrionales bacterium]